MPLETGKPGSYPSVKGGSLTLPFPFPVVAVGQPVSPLPLLLAALPALLLPVLPAPSLPVPVGVPGLLGLLHLPLYLLSLVSAPLVAAVISPAEAMAVRVSIYFTNHSRSSGC